jgi:hypothetical protein
VEELLLLDIWFYQLDDDKTALQNQLKANNKSFYFDYHDGIYGYNTSSSRGADTFVPFKSPITLSATAYVTNSVYRGTQSERATINITNIGYTQMDVSYTTNKSYGSITQSHTVGIHDISNQSNISVWVQISGDYASYPNATATVTVTLS